MDSKPDKKLLEALAGRQCGYFTAGQALDCGFSYQLHRYYCQKGGWARHGNGLFSLPGFPDSHKARLIRLSLWSRNQDDQIQAVVSHESALFHHGLLAAEPDKLHFTAGGRAFQKRLPEGCERHRDQLRPTDYGDFGCLKVTTPERTLSDCRAMLEGRGMWAATLRKALDSGLCDPDFVSRNRWLDAPELSRPAVRLAKGHVYLFTCGETHYHLPLLHALGKALRRHGLFMVAVPAENQEQSRPALLEALAEKPAGIVVDVDEPYFPFDLIDKLDGVKTVLLNATPATLINADFVSIDFRLGAYEATRHLLSLGHGRILSLLPAPSAAASFLHSAEYQYREGYLEALREAGLEGQAAILEETRDEADNQARLARLLKAPGRPTALIASQDFRLAVKTALFAELGLSAPGDLALVGFYDTPWCQATHPPLSSLRVDMGKMAETIALRLLLPPGRRDAVLVRPELVVRESSAEPRA